MHVLLRTAVVVLLLAVMAPVTAALAQGETRYPPSAQWYAAAAGSSKPSSHGQENRHATPPVRVRVNVGYGGQYRTTAWTPVRVTVQNTTNSLISGTVKLDDKSSNTQGPPRNFRTTYQEPLVLPAGATKQLTLYMPGYDVQDSVTVTVLDGDRTVFSGTSDATRYDDSAITAGTLVDDPTNSQWLGRVTSYNFTSTRLTPSTLDPYPQALATFDIITLTNVNASRLGHDQLLALDQFVRNGGTLVLVGGRDWQETLRPLPATLVPGQLAGTLTVPDLRGLLGIKKVALPRKGQPTTVTLLTHPRGTVLASQAGVPLVVKSALGKGQIVYLAFDPAVSPLPQWSGASEVLTRIMNLAAPQAMGRASYPNGYLQPPQFFNPWGPSDISLELSNVPAAALPSLILFITLATIYILLLGPVNFLVLRRMRRLEWTWVTVPLLAVLCVGSTFAIAFRLKGDTVLINTVGVVQLDGSDVHRPATLYAGLFAPLRGDYHLTYNGSAFGSGIQSNFYYNGPQGPQTSNPLTLQFEQGAQTGVTFLSMNMWSMRDIKLQTTVDVSGSIDSNLAVDSRGTIVGTVHNGTNLNLLHPAVFAGRSFAHLPDIPAGATVHVSLRPSNDLFDQSPVWMKLYGNPNYQGGGRFFGKPIFFLRGSNYPGACCSGPALPTENSLDDRIRNVATMLPDAWTIPSSNEVTLVAWNEQPLGSISVDGSTPQRRDLNLIAAPLSVHLSTGAFRLRPGTLGARLMDITPQASNVCCPGPPTSQAILLGVGGSATFQFHVPYIHTVHFQQLSLSVNAGGADGTDIGHVYDWYARIWRPVNLFTGHAVLTHPDRFLSPQGDLLVKLTATGSNNFNNNSENITIMDLHQDLQISGSGMAT